MHNSLNVSKLSSSSHSEEHPDLEARAVGVCADDGKSAARFVVSADGKRNQSGLVASQEALTSTITNIINISSS